MIKFKNLKYDNVLFVGECNIKENGIYKLEGKELHLFAELLQLKKISLFSEGLFQIDELEISKDYPGTISIMSASIKTIDIESSNINSSFTMFLQNTKYIILNLTKLVITSLHPEKFEILKNGIKLLSENHIVFCIDDFNVLSCFTKEWFVLNTDNLTIRKESIDDNLLTKQDNNVDNTEILSFKKTERTIEKTKKRRKFYFKNPTMAKIQKIFRDNLRFILLMVLTGFLTTLSGYLFGAFLRSGQTGISILMFFISLVLLFATLFFLRIISVDYQKSENNERLFFNKLTKYGVFLLVFLFNNVLLALFLLIIKAIDGTNILLNGSFVSAIYITILAFVIFLFFIYQNLILNIWKRIIKRGKE